MHLVEVRTRPAGVAEAIAAVHLLASPVSLVSLGWLVGVPGPFFSVLPHEP